MLTSLPLALALFTAQAQSTAPEPLITVGGQAFFRWEDYTSSPLFRELGLRCGTKQALGMERLPPSDCSMSSTTTRPDYDPTATSPRYRIPVVFHVLRSTSGGTGNVSDALCQSQVDVLNEDFQALAGTLGEDGNDARVEFFLATEDPNGGPSTGINRYNNTTWFNDGGGYYNSLNWDSNRYLNIYTNQASGALGYVRTFPALGSAGSTTDHVVLLYSAVGRNAPIGPPFNLGRTGTHEVGHWLGLFHTFENNGTCPSAANCSSNGDLICDTNPQLNPVFGCPLSHSSCSSSDPFHNYMDYSDDDCYTEFTPDQVNRIRCTLVNWRPGIDAGCNTTATVTTRNAGSNPTVYSATPAVLGGSTTLTVTDPTRSTAVVLGYAAPGNTPIASGVVLVNLASARLFRTSFALSAGSIVMPIPSDVALCGRTAYSQAVLLGGTGLALTNAVDLRAGI